MPPVSNQRDRGLRDINWLKYCSGVIYALPLVISGIVVCAGNLKTFPYQSTVGFVVFGRHQRA